MRVRNFTIVLGALLALSLLPSSAFAGQKAKLRFAATNSAAAENASTAQVAVTRMARNGKAKSATNTTVSVAYATSNGTAVAGSDYISTSGRLTFPACSTGAPAANDPCLRQVVTVPVLDDNVADGNRTVNLALTSPSRNAVVVNPQKTTLTIADNEGPTHVFFDRASYSVWEIGPQVEIHVFRSGTGISGSSTVDFSTSNGSATTPGDYTGESATLTFAPGEVDKTVLVDISDDSVVEPTETFSAGLGNASAGTTIDTASEQVTILDDDAVVPAHLAIDATPNPVAEGGDVTYTVTRTGSVGGPVSVDYATNGTTGLADIDFAAVADTLDFDPGDTTQSFTVSTLGDSLHEGDETFGVTLSNALPAGTVIDTGTANVTITDDDPVPTVSVGGGSVGGGTITYVIELTNPTTTDVTVTYVIVDSSGNQVGTGTATIPAGSTSTAVQAPATGSGPYDITISNATGGTIDPAHSSSTTPGQQQDPTISVGPSTGGTGGTAGAGSGSGSTGSTGSSTTFDVTISQPTDHPVTVDYEIHDGNGNTIGSGTVTIPAGETTVTVTAPVPAGTTGPVTVILADPAGATLAT